ncbi:hypothetical protein ACA910_008902 [Epithemia clementina (nom. ined.)]
MLFRTLLFLSPSLASLVAQAQTIAEVIELDPDLSIFYQAVVLSGQRRIYESDTNSLTVFAPTDAAFTDVAVVNPELTAALFTQPWTLHLQNLIETHTLVGDPLTQSEVSDGQVLLMSSNENVTVVDGGLSPSVVFESAAFGTETSATNGVVNQIDDVLAASFLNMSAYEYMEENGSTFAALASQAGLANYYNSQFGITVFLPSEEAFAQLSSSTVAFLTSPAGRSALQELLLYHTISEVVPSPEIPLGESEWHTTEGEYVAIQRFASGSGFVNTAQVLDTDILVNNGIIHMIDQVLTVPYSPSKGKGYGKGYSKGHSKGGGKKGSYDSKWYSKGQGYYAKGKGYGKGGGYDSKGVVGKGKGYPSKGNGYFSKGVVGKGKGYPSKGKGYDSKGVVGKGKGYPSKGNGFFSKGSEYSKGNGYEDDYEYVGKGYSEGKGSFAKGKGYDEGDYVGKGYSKGKGYDYVGKGYSKGKGYDNIGKGYYEGKGYSTGKGVFGKGY